MKLILSPAKSMEEEQRVPTDSYTQPQFFKQAVQLNRKLARMTKAEISKLMGISDKLADLNYQRYRDFDEENKTTSARPAMYLYAGDTYKGLGAYTIAEDQFEKLQQKVRIISGMYGLLRPLDLIQPYRLEMKIKLPTTGHKDLYEFWTDEITAQLNKELDEGELFLNLASNEYAKAVNFKKLKGKVMTPIFKDFKNGKLKVISFYAKQARGAMARFVVEHDLENEKEVLGFDAMDYQYSEKYTAKEEEPVFVR